MADMVQEFELAFDEILHDAKLEFMLASNDIVEDEIRVDTGENRAEAIAGWGAGHRGNGFRAGRGTHAVPDDSAARQAAKDSEWGEGVSTEVNTDHSFWVRDDETFEIVAEILQ